MYITKALIRTTTHNAFITVDDSGVISVFKYNSHCCDYDVFDNQLEAADYVVISLPDTYYKVEVQGDEPDTFL